MVGEKLEIGIESQFGRDGGLRAMARKHHGRWGQVDDFPVDAGDKLPVVAPGKVCASDAALKKNVSRE